MRQAQQRGYDAMLAVAAFCALVIVGVLSSRRKLRAGDNWALRLPEQSGDQADVQGLADVERLDDARDFRLLLTIMAGVALGAGVTALPQLMTAPGLTEWSTVAWLLWIASVISVILIYLATLTGSKLLRNKPDLVHTASIVAVFLAQCAMFVALAIPRLDSALRARLWFASFAAFGAAAAIAILLVVWKLPEWWRATEFTEGLKRYRRGQWSDTVMAALTALGPLIYLRASPEPSSRSALIASSIALGVMVVACIKQAIERRRLREDHLI